MRFPSGSTVVKTALGGFCELRLELGQIIYSSLLGFLMNILFLDDDFNRCKMVQSLIPSATIVKQASSAISWLETESHWDFISLDHDLGGEVMVDSDKPNTGMEVVRWIVENRPKIDYIIIHSFNPIGTLRMHHALYDAEYAVDNVPFNLAIYAGIADWLDAAHAG